MEQTFESQFGVGVVSAALNGVAPDWDPFAVCVAGFLGVSPTVRCAGSAGGVQMLTALGARLPLVSDAAVCAASSVQLLVTEGALASTDPWIKACAPGAVIVSRDASAPACQVPGAHHVVLTFRVGVSLSVLPNKDAPSDLERFVRACANDPELRARLVQILTAADSRFTQDRLMRETIQEQRAQIDLLQSTLSQEKDVQRALNGRISHARAGLNAVQNSGTWPVLRKVSSIRRRIQTAADALNADRPGYVSTDAFEEPASHAELLKQIPRIAGWFQQHGMRAGGWVDTDVVQAMQAQDLTLVAKSFYSVCPDLATLGPQDWVANKYDAAWECVPKQDFAVLLPHLERAAAALVDAPRENPGEPGVFFWLNEMFSPIDAMSYRAIIEHVQPKQILEVGSGNSTAIALGATQDTGTSVRCIEPYPSPFLRALEPRLKGLIQSKVEDVDTAVFGELAKDDILFIDSSHCARMSSDLNFLMFEALPRLQAGVVVHFHDIFLPNEYPETWLRDIGIMWNEQYQLLAFLMNNADYELIWSSSHAPVALGTAYVDTLRASLPEDHPVFANMGPYGGGSVWLRKLR